MHCLYSSCSDRVCCCRCRSGARLNGRCMTETYGQWQPPTLWNWELMLAHWMSHCTWASQVMMLQTHRV